MRIRSRLSTMLILAGVVLGLAVLVGALKPGHVTIRNKSGEILVEHDEFVSVDWESQTFVVGDSVWGKLNANLSSPFQVCVDDDVIYTGAITSMLSSLSVDGPVIEYPLGSPQPDSLTIQWGYPRQSITKVANDTRFSRRTYNSFWWSGKLKADDR